MGTKKLTQQELSEARSQLQDWDVADGTFLTRTYSTRDFRESLELANTIGKLAEKANHHPDLTVSWGKLTVTLSTHDAGGITKRDTSLAQEIDSALADRN